jgi:hypothetical protein
MIPVRRYTVEYLGSMAVHAGSGRRVAARRRQEVLAASESQALWRVGQWWGGSSHTIVGRSL